MARSINKVTLLGNLGKDPDNRFTPSGKQVASFSIATSSSWKDTSGELKTETEWHNCEVWGRLAEIAGQYLVKGSKVYVEGRLKTDKYEKDGIMRYSTKINVSEIVMLDGKGGGQTHIDDEGAPVGQMVQAPDLEEVVLEAVL